MANKLVVAPAPHVQTSQSTARIMRDVVIALMPALAVSSVVFGVDVLRVTALSVAACVLFEYLIQKFLVRGASTIGNWSAVVTGVLLAFNLPASIPWWIVLIGAFVAIAIAKMTFGGLGKNPFNPALVGRVFLLIAYPVQMTSFPVPVNGSFDALSGATPLAAVKHGAAAPHVQTSQSTARIMRDVVIALMPALAVSSVVFGVDVLRVTALSVAACVLFEYLIQKFLVRGASTIGNWSAVVTGVLLAFNLPASIPWWIVLIGAFVAIAIAKMTFGGLGKNPFNPALVGRVFLLIAYPVQMTSFPVPVNGSFDALSGATPLAAVKHGAAADVLGVQELLLGNMPGSLGEVAALALICGFVYLLWRRVITWQIPVTILGTMALFAFVVAAAKGGLSAGPVLWQFPLFHVLAGGALLGAIFMATDYSTSPMTVRGSVIFGVGIGAITMCIRLWGAYPEGMSFAILIMNAVVPLINKYVKPKRFGVK